MAKHSKNFHFSAEAGLFFVLLGVLLAGWMGNGPSNQELLANYAKSKDLWDLIVANHGFAWWTPNYLGGALTAPLAGTGLTMFWLISGVSSLHFHGKMHRIFGRFLNSHDCLQIV